jgi:hypothetical protein
VQLEHVARLQQRRLGDGGEALRVAGGVGHAAAHPVEYARVVALREHITKELSERERAEREDWSFEVALLMRNRFMAYEVYEEWFEHKITRAQWRSFLDRSPGMNEYRKVMFSRLVPNLREIGLLTPRIMPAYDRVGLMQYFGGKSADKLTGDELLAGLAA